jgi:hypothetical protein
MLYNVVLREHDVPRTVPSTEFDIYISVHHDTIYEYDQQDATV